MIKVIVIFLVFAFIHSITVARWFKHLCKKLFVFGALAFEYLDTWEFLGLKQAWRYVAQRKVAGTIEGLTQKELVTSGVYGIVRHPLYLAGIVVFTFNPRITVNGLTISILADLYFLFGTFIEERRFLRIFGGQYREYMKRVPRLVPGIWKPVR